MTTKEAREIYLKSDCSYFVMCTNFYASYIEYKKLGLPTDLENKSPGRFDLLGV